MSYMPRSALLQLLAEASKPAKPAKPKRPRPGPHDILLRRHVAAILNALGEPAPTWEVVAGRCALSPETVRAPSAELQRARLIQQLKDGSWKRTAKAERWLEEAGLLQDPKPNDFRSRSRTVA